MKWSGYQQVQMIWTDMSDHAAGNDKKIYEQEKSYKRQTWKWSK